MGQSEWLPGEKKKSKGLLGKLKNAVKKDRNISEEREFGSGSDISSASVQSKQSTNSKMSTASKLIQRARSASKDRLNASKGEEAKPHQSQKPPKQSQDGGQPRPKRRKQHLRLQQPPSGEFPLPNHHRQMRPCQRSSFWLFLLA